jgi:hypothetical protein
MHHRGSQQVSGPEVTVDTHARAPATVTSIQQCPRQSHRYNSARDSHIDTTVPATVTSIQQCPAQPTRSTRAKHSNVAEVAAAGVDRTAPHAIPTTRWMDVTAVMHAFLIQQQQRRQQSRCRERSRRGQAASKVTDANGDNRTHLTHETHTPITAIDPPAVSCRQQRRSRRCRRRRDRDGNANKRHPHTHVAKRTHATPRHTAQHSSNSVTTKCLQRRRHAPTRCVAGPWGRGTASPRA